MKDEYVGSALKSRREVLKRTRPQMASTLAPKMGIRLPSARTILRYFEDGYIYGTTSQGGIRDQGQAHLDRLGWYMEELGFTEDHELVTYLRNIDGRFRYPAPASKVQIPIFNPGVSTSESFYEIRARFRSRINVRS